MLGILQSIMLGIMQGITEWLPVSSSGHLVLVQKLFNLQVPVAFDVWLHVATLLVVIAFFYKDIARIMTALLRWQTQSYDFRLALFILAASAITAAVVLPFRDLFEKAFSSLAATGLAFLATGMLLFFSDRNIRNSTFKLKSALLVGLTQGMAFLPGISRSGSTISAALMLGIKKEDAFRFSFLILILPALGAGMMKINELASSSIPITSLASGFTAALIVGFLSLNFLKKAVMQGKFHCFAYYCWFIGVLALALHFVL